MNTDLGGRRLLVTGASSGIGAATARVCAAAGARVALVARRGDAIRALAEEVGGVPIPADLTDEPAAVAAVERAATELGGLDGLVNAAGLMRVAPIAEAPSSDWRAMFDLNVLALLVVTQAAIPHLRAAGGGDVVNVSSLSGRRVPSAPSAVYSASKFAVHAVSEGLRQELHDDGIRVVVAAPGFVRTELFGGNAGEAAQRLRTRADEVGLEADDVAVEIARVMGLPRGVLVREIALSGLGQDT